MINGYELAEYLFSGNEEERVYSINDYELDELLERAFSEGYEYAQREFGKKEKPSVRKDAGTGSMIGGAAGTGLGLYLGNKYTKGLPWKVNKEEMEIAKSVVKGAEEQIGHKIKNKHIRKIGKALLKYPKATALGAAGLVAGTAGAGIGSGVGAGVGSVRKVVRRVRDND